MNLLTQLQKSLASTCGRSSWTLTDPRAMAWIHNAQGSLFSSSSSGTGSSSSGSDDSDSDDDIEKTTKKMPAKQPKKSSANANDDVYDPKAGFEVLGKKPSPRGKKIESPSPSSSTLSAAEQQTPSSSRATEPAWRRIDGGFPVSTAFDTMLRRMRDVTEAQLLKEAEEEELTRRGNANAIRANVDSKTRKPPTPGTKEAPGTGPSSAFRPLQRATTDDFLLLAETVEAYLSISPFPDKKDGLGVFERSILASMATHIRNEHGDNGRSEAMPAEFAIGSPLETRVVNMAPPGRLAWEILGVEEERGAVHWAVDLTDGKAPDPWRNGRLSDAAKTAMYQAHKKSPNKYSVEELAKIFKIRQQRVMAIISLKELEEATEAAESPEAEELRSLMEEGVWNCSEATGSGEKHIVTVPSYPNYAEADMAAVMTRLEAALGKPISEISEEDLTPEIAQHVLGVKPQAILEEDLADKEEANLIEEFKRALDYNLGKTGQGISRLNRKTAAPQRPKEGWSLLVKPLGKEAEEKPYVSGPDGVKRELNEDEALMVERQTPRPRRRVL
jgi:Eukaryotic mitochondrial regulator protein